MADSANFNRLLNPWVLQFQKLGLELKCPLCLSLVNRPMLLPCDHIFCNFCVPRATQFGSECPICKQQYADRDIRPARYMENMVTIYRSLDATFAANLFDPVYSDAGRVPDQRQVSVDRDFDDKVRSESVETPQDGNSSNGQPIFLVTVNKRVQVSPNLSVEDGAKLTGKSDKSTLQKASQHEGCENYEADMGFCGVHVCIGAEEVDITQVVQSSQGSPPSSVDRKAVNNVIRVPGTNIDSVKTYPTERTVKKCSDRVRAEMNDRASLEVVDHAGEVKRQKILSNGWSGIDTKINGHAQPMQITTSKLETKSVELPSVGAPTNSDSSDTDRSVCAFCQSSKLTVVTGPMLHYANGNGKEVVGDAATFSNVIHVHRVCVDWTPQVYYVGEKVKNLKAEVSRAAKLSCSSCRLKGAALGCYVKSCRKSYHVPCAVETSGCKWDQDDFLLLCPSHSSVKFPREKSMSGKHSSESKHQLSTQIDYKLLSFWAASPNGAKEWVFCGSALSADEKYLLVKFASICGATVSKFWKPNVTHVIAATDAMGAYSRTLKVLMAILNGRWVLTIDWIKACMDAMHPVDEEPYEVNLDNYGCSNGPKTGRLRTLDNAPKLFDGLSFYFCGDFLPSYKEDLLDLVVSAGGTVIESKDQLVLESPICSTSLVVYNLDPPQECPFGEGSLAFQRLEAENLADEMGSQVIPHTWLLESIAACKLNHFAS